MQNDEEFDAVLIIADSERDSDLYYATGFLAPDPFIFIQRKEQKILIMSDLEIDRAKSESRADLILSYSKYENMLKRAGKESPFFIDVLDSVLQEMEVESLLVPGNFGIEYADGLREMGYQIAFRKPPFFSEREVKSEEEIGYIKETLKSAQNALDAAIRTIGDSKIGVDDTLYRNGEPLTSEAVRKIINVKLMEENCIASGTIVASEDQCCDPHNRGSGCLKAHQTIIMDIFPKSVRTGYYADITRTVVKGEASSEVKGMYGAVAKAQEIVLKETKEGADGSKIHSLVLRSFEEAGYKSGEIDGRMQGFFHGTGHGVGLDIHEPPRMSKTGQVLKSGHVVTNEPGLYYIGIGGIRIEDLMVVRKDVCENLTSYPKELEI